MKFLKVIFIESIEWKKLDFKNWRAIFEIFIAKLYIFRYAYRIIPFITPELIVFSTSEQAYNWVWGEGTIKEKIR